jgi:hypothetical protein
MKTKAKTEAPLFLFLDESTETGTQAMPKRELDCNVLEFASWTAGNCADTQWNIGGIRERKGDRTNSGYPLSHLHAEVGKPSAQNMIANLELFELKPQINRGELS